MTPGQADALPAPLAQLDAPPVFVVGVHRSGTTWVYDMLAGHPQAAGVFESGLFTADLGVAPLFHPAHWYVDAERLERDRRFFGSSFRLNQLLDREQALSEIRELTAAWLARSLEPHHRFLVEKTPQHLQTMRLIDELFPGSAFVHVIRDGRDVVASLDAAARSWPAPGLRSRSRRQLGEQWAHGVSAGREQARAGGLRYLEVRYEDLRGAPEEGLRQLYDHCSFPADDELIGRICEATALASQREGGGDDAFRRKGRVGDWREGFGLRDRFEFDRVAGGLLVELGYETGRRWWLSPRRAIGAGS